MHSGVTCPARNASSASHTWPMQLGSRFTTQPTSCCCWVAVKSSIRAAGSTGYLCSRPRRVFYLQSSTPGIRCAARGSVQRPSNTRSCSDVLAAKFRAGSDNSGNSARGEERERRGAASLEGLPVLLSRGIWEPGCSLSG